MNIIILLLGTSFLWLGLLLIPLGSHWELIGALFTFLGLVFAITSVFDFLVELRRELKLDRLNNKK